VPTKIEQILDSSMGSNKSLRLSLRLESSHPPLSHPSSFMRLFDPIILILLGAVDRLRHDLPMGDWITSQLISDDLPGFTSIASQQSFEEAFSRSTVTLRLQVNVYHILCMANS
jgi:hypothetical protein